MDFVIEKPVLGKGSVCEKIMRSLPQWFGIETAIIQYAKDIEKLPTFVAVEENETIGFLTIKQHNQFAAEIYVMGVLPQLHGKGIGRNLVETAENFSKKKVLNICKLKLLVNRILINIMHQQELFI